MSVSEHRIQTGAFETFYHESGAGHDTTILLLHGSGPGATAISNWQFALPFLSEKYHCLAPDIAGFGETRHPSPPLGAKEWIKVWVRQLIDFLDAKGLKKVQLVGNSMGGGVSLHLARSYPERFEKIVLMGAVGVPFIATEGLSRGWGYYKIGTKDELAYLVSKFLHRPEIMGDDLNAIAENRFKFVMRDEVRLQYESMFPGNTQDHVDAFVIPDGELQKMPHRFLLTHGREDFFIPLENSYYMASRIPNAQLHVFHHCGHWIQIEQRKAFNQIVRDFFDGDLD